jgi:hypothetical protein
MGALRVLSLGAGVQSSTLALMIAAGELPMIECAIFADTQSEPRKVYAWLDWLEQQLPFPVHRVTAGNLQADILADLKPEVRYLLPTYTNGGGLGKRQCTRHYKLRPIRRKVRELAKGRMVEQLIGISLDEALRMKPSGVAYIRNAYPLVEARLTRGHCIEWLWNKFQRRAPKSACKFCPFHDEDAWQQLDADEQEESFQLDEFVRDRGADPGVQQFLHPARIPLRKVDLRTPTQRGQRDFINECEGMCGV